MVVSERKNVIWLSDCWKDEYPTRLIGGKAKNLGILKRNRFNCPDGFVVSTSVQVRYDGERFAHQDRQAIMDAYHYLTCYVAVRSSGVKEDGDEESMAGKFSTFVYIFGDTNLLLNIRKCYESGPGTQMAVVVQRMVNPVCAGVMFTTSPFSWDDGKTLIEGSWGLGSIVVDGMVVPDTFKCDTTGMAKNEKELGKKAMKRFLTDSNIVMGLPTTAEEQESFILTDVQVFELSRIGKNIEKVYSRPMDVEWLLDEDGMFHIVQARPLTTILSEFSMSG